jgi:hypothetical protein
MIDTICYDDTWLIWYDIIDIWLIWYIIWYDIIWLIWWYIIWLIWYICYDDMIWLIWYDDVDMIYDMILIYLLTAIGLTPGGSSTVHIYTQTVGRTTQLTTLVGRLSGIRTQVRQTNWEECGPCPVFAIYTLEFALQVRKKHVKTSVRVAKECQLARWKLCLRDLDLEAFTLNSYAYIW